MKYVIQNNSNRLLNNFDLLRFFLASVVFLVHSSNLSAVNELKLLENLSSLFAVKSFFVCHYYGSKASTKLVAIHCS